ncbi:MAG TPA: hypothetical protein VGB44_10540 [Flavobacterium sp.]|jgi:hypothetical protein
MKNLAFCLAAFLCLIVNKATAQNTFEERVKAIAEKIDAITKEEKAALKLEVEAVNQQLANGGITPAEADERKLKLAESRARSIENRVAAAQDELNALVKDRVDGKIKDRDSTKVYKNWFDKQETRAFTGETRTTSQLVLAMGWANSISNGALAHSDFGAFRSVFWEWGVTYNTRILKKSNLLHFKYGVTGVYNYLAPTENRYFVVNGNKTELQTFPHRLDKNNSFFKNVYVTIPMHLEFDFSKTEVKDDRQIFRSHQSYRFGIGGFVGYNTNTKQVLHYEVNDYKIKEKVKGDWNVNDWTYGLSAYVGHKDMSLYIKYDLNPLFENNDEDLHNIALGLRFDFN